MILLNNYSIYRLKKKDFCPPLDKITYPKLILQILIYYGNYQINNFQGKSFKGWRT